MGSGQASGDTAVSTQVLASKLWLRGCVVPELSGRGEGQEGHSEL